MHNFIKIHGSARKKCFLRGVFPERSVSSEECLLKKVFPERSASSQECFLNKASPQERTAHLPCLVLVHFAIQDADGAVQEFVEMQSKATEFTTKEERNAQKQKELEVQQAKDFDLWV